MVMYVDPRAKGESPQLRQHLEHHPRRSKEVGWSRANQRMELRDLVGLRCSGPGNEYRRRQQNRSRPALARCISSAVFRCDD
jgi:hypothetical protein